MFVNKLFTYFLRAHISKSKRCFNVNTSTYYFSYEDEDILADF